MLGEIGQVLLILALLAALLQFQGMAPLIGVAVVYGGGQLLESVALTPWLVGERIGLHPVAVIFAVMAGGQLFGFLGMLLALPAAAVINVLLRYAQERYRQSELYAGHGPTIVLPASHAEPANIGIVPKDADPQ